MGLIHFVAFGFETLICIVAFNLESILLDEDKDVNMASIER